MSDDIPCFPALLELRTRAQWVCWRYEQRDGEPTKVPYTPRTAKRAESDDPETWGTYQEACQALCRHGKRYDGVGYMFHREITGIDLDHCIDETGQIEPWAQTII